MNGHPVDLTIVVISTNESEHINRLFQTMSSAVGNLRTEILLVDNASDDCLYSVLSEHDDLQVEVIHNSDKLSFTRNNNLALSRANGKYILFLNPDTVFEGGQTIREMFDFMERNKKCGISGCRAYHYDGTFAYPARRYQTLTIVLSRRFPVLFHSRRAEDDYLYRRRNEADTYRCEWLSGCFLFARTIVVKEIGGFDTHFHKYFEDVDICSRVSEIGCEVIYHGRPYYFHLERRKSADILSVNALLHLRSYLRWICKSSLRRLRRYVASF